MIKHIDSKKVFPCFEVGGPVKISVPRVHSPSFSYPYLTPTPRLKILKLGKQLHSRRQNGDPRVNFPSFSSPNPEPRIPSFSDTHLKNIHGNKCCKKGEI